nr:MULTISPECIES: hypothetical protein [unclassified Streptomyces]
MSDARTTPARPVRRSHPPDAPEPATGCDVCAALAKQRAEAQARGDLSSASDCNVELAAHPHRRATDRKSRWHAGN